MGAAFASWIMRRNQRQFARRFLGKMVGRWKNKEIAGGFNAWLAFLQAGDCQRRMVVGRAFHLS